MKVLRAHAISWFLEDEVLAPAMAGLTEDRESRRTHMMLEYGGRRAFVKYFREKGIIGLVRNRIAPRGKIEYVLAGKLRAFSISTPSPLGYGIGPAGSFVLQEWIEGRTFRSCFLDEQADRPALLGQLAHLLRQLKAHGVVHNDLHLDNLLLSAGKLYLIDLHKTKVRKNGLSHSDELINLTHAAAMVYADMTAEERLHFFQEYGSPHLEAIVDGAVRRLRTEWIERKKKRAFVTTSELFVRGQRVYLRGGEERGRGEFTALMKQDKKVRIERYTDHVRKIYRNRRRLKKAWRTHVVMAYMGLDIVPHAFFVQLPSLFTPGFIAMEDLSRLGREFDRFLDDEYDAMNDADRREMIDGLSLFFSGFLKEGVFQKDMKGCNLFVVNEGFRLLDVEDIVVGEVTEKDLKRMLVQLNTTVPARIPAVDRIRFFVKCVSALGFDKKRLFREVTEGSRVEEIVYEGSGGLKREAWPERPRGPLSPFSHPLR